MTRSRLVGLAALLSLAGCGLTPDDLGITGPGTAQRPVASHASDADADAVNQPPGLPVGFGATYAPSIGPRTDPGGTNYYGYN